MKDTVSWPMLYSLDCLYHNIWKIFWTEQFREDGGKCRKGEKIRKKEEKLIKYSTIQKVRLVLNENYGVYSKTEYMMINCSGKWKTSNLKRLRIKKRNGKHQTTEKPPPYI